MNKVKRLKRRIVGMLLTMAYLWMASGCLSWHSADGTRHTLIVGIGLVSTKETPDQSATALRAHTLGLALRPPHGGLVLGYQSLHVTTISPDWQGLAQVSDSPGQPLTVEGYVSSTKITPTPAATQGGEFP